jgi:hypothetical protein
MEANTSAITSLLTSPFSVVTSRLLASISSLGKRQKFGVCVGGWNVGWDTSFFLLGSE